MLPRHRAPATSIAIASALFLVLSVGCENNPAPDLQSIDNPLAAGKRAGESELDKALKDLLLDHADGGGLKYYRLPNANQLKRIPQDPKNPLSQAKIELGKLLYHETALAVDNVREEGFETYSCASCHHMQAGFQANVPQGIAEGGTGFGVAGEGRTFLPQYDAAPHFPDCQPIRTPTALNTAYQELMLWNGQFGGVGDNIGTEDQWTPGTPKESNIHGMHGLETQVHAGMTVHRMGHVNESRVASIPKYQRMFRKAFWGDPEPITHMNVALAVAAYERTLLANKAPFQRWLRGDMDAMTAQEKRGAIVFFGDGGCVGCHTGPALSSMTFFALGMHDLDNSYDPRVNLAPFGGTIPDDVRRGRGGFTGRSEDDYKFKTPQLYNLKDSPFYGHGASFATVREVIAYKNAAVPQNAVVPTGQLAEGFKPLGLSDEQMDDLAAFIDDALYDAKLSRYVPKHLPSGNCFPVSDIQAQQDLGCTGPSIITRR